MAAAAAVMLRREREVVEAFRRAGATSPAQARSLGELNYGETVAVHRLRRRAVLRESEPGRYYLDEASWVALRGIRRRLLFVLFGIALLLLLGILTTALRLRA